MQCPKCGSHFEIIIKETSQPAVALQHIIQPVQQIQPVEEEHTRLLPPSNKPNKISDEEFLRAQRILSMAAQGRK